MEHASTLGSNDGGLQLGSTPLQAHTGYLSATLNLQKQFEMVA